MIIDSHTHLYPQSVYNDPAEWAKTFEESYWLSCVLPEKGLSLQGWVSVDQLLKDMDAAGVDKVVIQSWYWENHRACEESLSWQLEWVKAHPDRFIGFAPFNAQGGAKSIELLRLAFDAGFKGIGEINPPAQGYAYDDELLDRALEMAAQAKALVTVHVTEPAGNAFPGKIETPFDKLQSMAQRNPDTRFIFAHLGGLLPFHEFNPNTRKSLANVWYDTAAAPLLYSNLVYRTLCDVIDPKRILFGTDYPLRTFPKEQRQPSFQHHIDQLKYANLSEDELAGILGNNLASLLAL